MALTQEQQLEAILTAYGSIVGLALILLGLALTLAGTRVIPILVAWALFIPFAFTAGAVANSFLGVSSDVAIWIGIGVGMLAGVSGASLGQQIHLVFGGAVGLAVMAVILSFVVEYQSIDWLVAAIALDLAFIIGAGIARNAKDAVQFVGSASLGGLSLAAGITMRSAGIEGLESFDPSATTNAVVIIVCIVAGSMFQQWRFGENYSLD